MKQIARLNYLKIAPRKVRLVAGLLRGLTVNEAEAQLLVLRKRSSPALLKLLRSAVANAKNNQKLDEEKLFIESFRVDGAPMLKRFLPRARGRATPIQKKMSHVTLVLSDGKQVGGARFKIVRPKKVKLPPGVEKKGRERHQGGEMEKPKPAGPGFIKRLFNRKAGFAK